MLPFISGHDLSLADEALGWEWADNAVENACSFSADTPVATAHGETAISAIHTGDQVLAYNEQTGATGYYTVTATLQHADPTVVHLKIDGEAIETTPEHPFYQVSTTTWWLPGEWTPAGQLHQSDLVRKADGTTGVVQTVAVESHAQVMYNLTVATAHTFFVGEDQWLVHNSCTIENAKFLHSRRDPGHPQTNTTTAILSAYDPDGNLKYLVANNYQLTDSQLEAIKALGASWEAVPTPNALKGTHPEELLLTYAELWGYSPQEIVASWQVCSTCQDMIASLPYPVHIVNPKPR